jgi:hypothetical protein
MMTMAMSSTRTAPAMRATATATRARVVKMPTINSHRRRSSAVAVSMSPHVMAMSARVGAHRRDTLIVRSQVEDDIVANSQGDDDAVANISRKVARTSKACKSLGRAGFWAQLVLTTVAAVIVVFSFLYKGLTKSTDAGLYFILFGLCAGFFTTFWSLGIVRLGDKLRKGAKDLDLVPPRTEVIRTLSTGLTVNIIGLGATIIGLQATTGMLFAKTLTAAAAVPMYGSPVVGTGVALDIFLVQAASNAMLAHWFGAAVSLWLLRTVNLPSPPKAA